jgi:hypothetical protein
MQIAPWDEVAIDLIDPSMVTVNNQKVEFNSLTWMNTATNLVDLIYINNKTLHHILDEFIQCWLAWYPFPIIVYTTKAVNV